MPRKCGHLLELSMAVLKLRTPARRQGQSRSYPWRVVQRIALRAAQRIIQRLSIWCINHCTANHAARSATSSAASIVCALAEVLWANEKAVARAACRSSTPSRLRSTVCDERTNPRISVAKLAHVETWNLQMLHASNIKRIFLSVNSHK